MKKIIQFGEHVEGYTIPVLNEREIRAAAGILFLMMFITIQRAAQFQDFLLLKYAIVVFLTDMVIRVFVNPKYAPTLIIGRFIGFQKTVLVGPAWRCIEVNEKLQQHHGSKFQIQ